ncbi:CMRF35-like molecule 1 [Oncorhynchus tshawytscha]|uniref:Immunoglobulin domain-containing protein n=1 Tax=Oncorhynchus tshawytscha TaxID=74940 RepID=A0A8C8ICS3_ONCTS|nr:CMRF35-like molecule 1 [Oncorhynchus tshawytscha]
MTSLRRVFFSLSAALWSVSIADEIVVSGYEGGEAEISCSYGHGYENYKKYLCNRGCDNSDIVIETQLGVHHTKKGSFSLHDDIKRRVFTVNVTKLTLQHAGIYWCAVSRYGKDIYTEVRLQVVKETTTPLSPSPMTLVTTVTSVTSTSSLSSASTSSSLMPPSSAGFTNRTYVFIAFTVMTFSVSLSVLMLALIIIYRCKRIQGSAEPHRETGLSESVYEDVYENTEAVCVNVKLASCKKQYSSQPYEDVDDDDDAQQESVYQDITPYDNIYQSLNITTTDGH